MIVSLGDAVVDIVAAGLTTLPAWGEDREVERMTAHRGGAALNVAVNLAALDHPSALVAGVGQDSWATFLRDGLQEKGVDGRGVVVINAPTAVTMVLSGGQDRAFVSVYGATAAFKSTRIVQAVWREATHVHISGYWQSRTLAPHLPDLCAVLQEGDATVSLDVGYDPTGEWTSGIEDLLPFIDIFFPNEEEALGITGASDWQSALRQLAEVVPWVAIKRGSEGATVRGGGVEHSQSAFDVPVVDTTGAGDAFNSGFLHGWLQGWSPEQTLRFACGMGALCVMREGGSTTPPTGDEVMELVNGHSKSGGIGL